MEIVTTLPEGHVIRACRREDLTALYAIECASQQTPWTQEHFRAEYQNPVASIDLYWIGQSIAGFLCSWLVAGELQIQNLATAVSFRRRGVAGRLLNHVLQRSRRVGLEATWLEVRVNNQAAIELYRRFGFIDQMRRSNYYPDGEDALLMSLPEDDPCLKHPRGEKRE